MPTMRIIPTIMAVCLGHLGFAHSICAKPSQGNKNRDLTIPDELHSFEPVHTHIRDLFVDAHSIIMIPDQKLQLVRSPFVPLGKTNQERFGKLTESIKHDLSKGSTSGPWDSVNVNGRGILLLNGNLLRFSKVGHDGSFDTESDIIYDSILPAADSRGEPPSFEIKRVRANFLNQMRKRERQALLGLRLIPNTWQPAKGNLYLALTSLRDFPLVQLSCSNQDASDCKITRTCNIEGLHGQLAYPLSGLALHPEKREILIADQGGQRIHILNYHSCFHSTYKGSLNLPKRLRTLSGVFIDGENRLWISTLGRDDYFNASIFYWEPGQWDL